MTFSIVCLTYKRIELLEESVFSVLQQTYPQWELLIINDCALQTIYYDHPKVKIFNLKDKFKTIAEKRNFGVKSSTGDLILQLDDDDFLLPEYLENLKQAIGNRDWLVAQRPILYYDDPSKICLCPLPQTNTFLYRRISVGEKFHYETTDGDEGITLNPFYNRVRNNSGGVGLYKLLKPDRCGYVWRQGIGAKRKYSMASFLTKKTTADDQNTILQSIEDRVGDITLVPKWDKDYVTIIKSNFKMPPVPEKCRNKERTEMIEKAKQKAEAWKSVKFSWENALKFIEAASSRGVISTAVDVLGINETSGNRVSEETYRQRKLSCFGHKDNNIEPCSRLKQVESIGHFCGTCGCGDSKLARLDGDGYTKLHYPELQCPLKRKGFSNEEKPLFPSLKTPKKDFPLSIIIPALDETPEILQRTIQSIRDTAGNHLEIIIVDDCSIAPIVSNEKVIRNTERMGTGVSRHIGASAASHDWFVFIDSHMVFEKGWYENLIERIDPSTTRTAYCGICLGLNAENCDLKNHRGAYYGAELVLYDEKQRIIEGKWTKEIKNQDNYEISCMMGALYFVPKELYFRVRGFSDLRMWGSLEPCLSTKIWLSGGEIRLLKTVRAGHIFRSSAPYSTGVQYLVYNKIRLAMTLFPKDLGDVLISKLPQDENFFAACKLIEKDKKEIEEYAQYYESIFTKDVYWLCKKFNILLPKK